MLIENGLEIPHEVTDSIFIIQCPGKEYPVLSKVQIDLCILF